MRHGNKLRWAFGLLTWTSKELAKCKISFWVGETPQPHSHTIGKGCLPLLPTLLYFNLLPLWAGGIRTHLLWSVIPLFWDSFGDVLYNVYWVLASLVTSCDAATVGLSNFRLSSPRPGDLPAITKTNIETMKQCKFAQCLYDNLLVCNAMTLHWHNCNALYTYNYSKTN